MTAAPITYFCPKALIPVDKVPANLSALKAEAKRLGFGMSCDDTTGRTLRALVASKTKSVILELGTGIGIGTAWMMDGLPLDSKLVSVDINPETQEIARQHLGNDLRLAFHIQDGAEFIDDMKAQRFGLIFADARPGKREYIRQTIALLDQGGIYIADDMIPLVNATPSLIKARDQLRAILYSDPELKVIELPLGSGLIIAVKSNPPPVRRGRKARL